MTTSGDSASEKVFKSEGGKGLFLKELEKYDYLMRIDDDSYFKGKIDFDLFDILFRLIHRKMFSYLY